MNCPPVKRMPGWRIEVLMEHTNNSSTGKTFVYVVTIVATFLLMGFLVRQMTQASRTAPLGAERGAARAKDNADIAAASAVAISTWGYADQAKGVVRMPIDAAVATTIQGYRNPNAFRKDLVDRAEKAGATPPPPPEKPGEFE
jgi:hypothetical protein